MRPILCGKPHLRLKDGVWSYATLCDPSPRAWLIGAAWRIGYGYTWREAYEDWKRQA